jgi:hypothetical protein
MAFVANIATVLVHLHLCIGVSNSFRFNKIRSYRILRTLQNNTNAALDGSHTALLFLLCTFENV